MIISDQLIDEAMYMALHILIAAIIYCYNSIQSPWQRSTGTSIKFSLFVGGFITAYLRFLWNIFLIGFIRTSSISFYNVYWSSNVTMKGNIYWTLLQLKRLDFWEINNSLNIGFYLEYLVRFLSAHTSSSNSYNHLF